MGFFSFYFGVILLHFVLVLSSVECPVVEIISFLKVFSFVSNLKFDLICNGIFFASQELQIFNEKGYS